MKFKFFCSAIWILVSFTTVKAITVHIDRTASHNIPSTLWGMMFEVTTDLGDGGLYAELLQNRAFQQVTPGTDAALAGWQAINAACITVIKETVPVSPALPNAIRVVIPSGKSDAVGFANTGFTIGIKVTAGMPYKASFYYRFPISSSFTGTLTVGLQTTEGQVLAASQVLVCGSQTSWKQVNIKLIATITPPSTANLFAITLDGGAANGQTIHFAMLSLFPPTFNDRPNGMRIDIAQALQEARPSFWRFPGGNNLEGKTASTRWKWYNTVGPLLDRPGRMGDWGYVNTDGLGLLEYLHWCEDLDMQPIMAVWAGYAVNGTSVPENALGPYIQEAIDQINFVIGDPADSAPASLRASLGHPAPFSLKYVEVGNEDFFAQSSYAYRWDAFVTVLRAKFPQLVFISTSYLNKPALSPAPVSYDLHVYQIPAWFAQNTFYYDSFPRDGTKFFEGEYAAISTNETDPFAGRFVYPTMQGSVAEAAFMTGLERNSDIVQVDVCLTAQLFIFDYSFAASYAPLMNHVSDSQWTPNLLSFDAGAVYKSTSYYVQKLFSLNRGDAYLPSTLPNENGTLFWSVVRQCSTNEIIIKISNTIETPTAVTFVLSSSFKNAVSTGTAQVLSAGDATTSNTPSSPNSAVPVTRSIVTGRRFTYEAPGYSLNVLTFIAH
ncbi:arabinofuranosidase [Amanita rubescens]|nr:arabinofuranosidase [Amanita rubescens]